MFRVQMAAEVPGDQSARVRLLPLFLDALSLGGGVAEHIQFRARRPQTRRAHRHGIVVLLQRKTIGPAAFPEFGIEIVFPGGGRRPLRVSPDHDLSSGLVRLFGPV